MIIDFCVVGVGWLCLVVVLLVELLLDNLTREGFLAYLNFYGVTHLDAAVDKSYGATLINGNQSVACSHFAYFHTIFEHLVAMSGHGVSLEFYSAKTLTYSFGFLLCQGFATNEFFFVEFAEHGKAGHDVRDVLTELVTVERQSNLEAQCVATTQSARFALATFNQFVPCLTYIVVASIDLKSVFASISST